MHEMRSPQNILALCRELDLKTVVLATTDLLGRWCQMTLPVSRLDESIFEDGITVDRKLLLRFGLVSPSDNHYPENPNLSDLSLIPIPETAVVDRTSHLPSLILLGSLQETVTRNEWLLDGRPLAKRAVGYGTSSGTADAITATVQLEYRLGTQKLLHGDPRTAQPTQWSPSIHGLQADDTTEMNASRYLVSDCLFEFEARLVKYLVSCGVPIEAHWNTSEDERLFAIRLRSDSIVRAADWIAIAKRQINVFLRMNGFPPSFVSWTKGSFTKCELFPQLGFYRGNESLLSGSGRDGFSDSVIHAMAGIALHRNSLLTLTNLTDDSYRRIVETLPQTDLKSSHYRALSRTTRLSFDSRDITQTRIELGLPDGASNPYVAMSAIVLAIIDGLQNKLGGLLTNRSSTTNGLDMSGIVQTMAPTLTEAIEALKTDATFMTLGDTFNDDWMQSWTAAIQSGISRT